MFFNIMIVILSLISRNKNEKKIKFARLFCLCGHFMWLLADY